MRLQAMRCWICLALAATLYLVSGCSKAEQPMGESEPVPTPQVTGPAPLNAADFQIEGVLPGQPLADLEAKLGGHVSKIHQHGLGSFLVRFREEGLAVYADLIGTDSLRGWEVSQGGERRTARGIGIGATLEAVLAAYGPGQPMERPGPYLIYESPEFAPLRLGFEFRYGKVYRMGAGDHLPPAIGGGVLNPRPSSFRPQTSG